MNVLRTHAERLHAQRMLIGKENHRVLWCARCSKPVAKIEKIAHGENEMEVRVQCHGQTLFKSVPYTHPSAEDGVRLYLYAPESPDKLSRPLDRHGRVPTGQTLTLGDTHATAASPAKPATADHGTGRRR